MSVWTIEADKITLIEDFDDSILLRTPDVDTFLEMNKNRHYLLMATKGVGKTFLLTAKRLKYQRKRDTICLPVDKIRDDFKGRLVLDKNTISLLKNILNWSSIWQLAISLAILTKLKISIDVHSKLYNSLFSQGVSPTLPSDFVFSIITRIKEKRSILFEFNDIYRTEIQSLVQGVRKSVAVFIDRIDECFHSHISASDHSLAQALGELDPDVWTYAQIGLLDAVYTLTQANTQLKVFAAIRREAFYRCKSAPLHNQYRSISLDIRYGKRELEDMFKLYIRKEDKSKLVNYSILANDPIAAFLGLSNFSHCVVGGEERIFDYIHRHSLGCPRDLMVIGSALSRIPLLERNEDKLKDTIDYEARQILLDYVRVGLAQYWDANELLEQIIAKIRSNVLSRRRLRAFCGKYNKIKCTLKDCRNCALNHVFCTLYKYGLLGVIQKDLTRNKYYQKFLRPGEIAYGEHARLPESKFYLLHPVTYSWRNQFGDSDFEIDPRNVVGPGLEWFDDKILKTSASKNKSEVSNRKHNIVNNNNDNNEQFIEVLKQYVCDDYEFKADEEPQDIATTRYDAQLVISRFLGQDEATILELGCGQGMILEALCRLDGAQLKTMTYIGVNYKDTEMIEKYAQEKGFIDKFKKCQIMKYEYLEYLKIKADHVMIVDVLHHLNPAELALLIRKSVFNLRTNGHIYISEAKKERENERLFLTSQDLSWLIHPYDFLKTRVCETSIASPRSLEEKITLASIEKIQDGEIDSSFEQRCMELFETRKAAINKEINSLNKKDQLTVEEIDKKSILTIQFQGVQSAIDDAKYQIT